MKLWLVGACILYLSLPLALGLKCEAGCRVNSDVPGSEKACNGLKFGSITCSPLLDRCMTSKFKIPGPFRGFSSDMEIKNCSSRSFCEPSSDFNCLVSIEKIYQTLKAVLDYISKHLEVRRIYSATRRIFNSSQFSEMWSRCKLMNNTLMTSACSLHCCEDDMCNSAVHRSEFVRWLLSRFN